MASIKPMGEQAGKRMRDLSVLLVDDHPQIRAIITSILTSLGIARITKAERGDDAFALMANSQFDLIITDLEMPGLSGIALARAIRGEVRSKNPLFDGKVPIIMVTSHATKERLADARNAGIDEMMVKPFTAAAVAARVQAAVLNRRPFILCPTYVGPCRRRTVSATYFGPWRRSDDVDTVSEQAKQLERDGARDEARTLCRIGMAGVAINDNVRTEIITNAHSTASRARTIQDQLLERAALSMVRYMQICTVKAAHAGFPPDPRIVEMHGFAIMQLLDLAGRDLALSIEVVDGLERAVARACAPIVAAKIA